MVNITYLTADWCQPCKKYLPVVQRLTQQEQIPLTVLDYDSTGADLARRHNVLTVPTLIIRHNDQDLVVSGPRSRGQLKTILGDLF